MSDVPGRDEPATPDSLAAQAAAWVPPWAREAPADPAAGGYVAASEQASAEELAEEPGWTGDGELDPQPGWADQASVEEPEPAAEPTTAAEPEWTAEAVVDQERGPATAIEPDWVHEADVDQEAEPVDQEAEPVDQEAEPVDQEAEPAVGEWAADPGEGELASGDWLPAAVDAEAVAGAGDPVAGAADEMGAADGGTPEEAQPVIDLRPALEAILLVVDEPVSEQLLAQVLEQPADTVAAELAALAAEYHDGGRGFELRRAAGGWRLYTRPEYAAYVERFVLDGQSVRLTQAALETLAVVAYKQPVTRGRISAIRGVNCDGVVRTLVTRGLIEESGTEPETGAYLYRTSSLFLEKLGLDSVDQLPPLAPFLPDNVDEIAGDVGR